MILMRKRFDVVKNIREKSLSKLNAMPTIGFKKFLRTGKNNGVDVLHPAGITSSGIYI